MEVGGVPMSDPVPSKSRILHWGWFLIGTMLIIFTFAVIRFGLPVYRQQQVIADFKTRGLVVKALDEPTWLPGWISQDWKVALSSGFEIDPHWQEFDDEDLIHVANLTKLQKLLLNKTNITDAGLSHLAKLTNLKDLRLG